MESKLQNTNEGEKKERTSKEIKQDLAAKGEQFSRTVEQLGERIEEKMDWRSQVKKTPFWAVTAATGLGFLAAGLVRRRTTPMDRLFNTLNSSVRGGSSGSRGHGLARMTLVGIAARTATHFLVSAPSIPTEPPTD